MKLSYVYSNETAGSADGIITLSGGGETVTAATLFWANDDGKLADYLPIKTITVTDGSAEYSLTGKRSIPQGATQLLCEIEGTGQCASFSLPSHKLLPVMKPQYTFFCITDIHGAGDYWQNKKNRDAAFCDIASFSPTHVIVGGDITNAGQAAQYETVKEYIETFFPEIPVLFATGNHDYNTYVKDLSADLAALDAFFVWQSERNSRLGAVIDDCMGNRYVTDFRGIRYIILNSSDVDNKFSVGEVQRNWLSEKLDEVNGAKQPSFVVSHFPVCGKTGLGSLLGRNYFSDNDQTEEILNRHRCVYVSGHTHYNLDSDDVNVYVGEEAPSYINAGCAVWTQNGYDENGKDIYIPERAMGQCVEVYDDYFLVRGRDFTVGKFIPRCEHRIFF